VLRTLYQISVISVFDRQYRHTHEREIRGYSRSNHRYWGYRVLRRTIRIVLMSDALYTSAQATEFDVLLSTRRQRLLALLRSQRVVEASTIYLVGCTAERDVDRRTVDLERRQLADIDSALHRLETGGFGLCARCGRAIRISRLHVSPTTQFCRRCAGNAVRPPLGAEARPHPWGCRGI
jgi:DnaK suppressor protein